MAGRLLGFALLSTLAACASSADEVASSEHDETAGRELARVTVFVPPGSVEAKILVTRSNDSSPTEVKPGIATWLPAGDYCVWTRIDRFDTKKACGYTFRGVSTVTLGSVRFTRSRNEAVLGIDLLLGHQNCNQAIGTIEDVAFFLHRTDVVLPHAPGEYTYAYVEGDPLPSCLALSYLADYTFTVKPFETTNVDLNDTRGHEALRLNPPSSRKTIGWWNPNALAQDHDGVELVLDSGDSVASYRFSSIHDRPLLVRQNRHASVTLRINEREIAKVESASDKIPELTLQRLDLRLDDVGSAFSGSCRVRQKGSTGYGVYFPLPGGLDLPAGEYEELLSYPGHGQTVFETRQVTLP